MVFLVVSGLKTSGGKAELVAWASLAVEFKLPSIESSGEQQKDYDAGQHKKHFICNTCTPCKTSRKATLTS